MEPAHTVMRQLECAAGVLWKQAKWVSGKESVKHIKKQWTQILFLSLMHLSWVRIKQTLPSRELKVKVCLECPLCNINHKSNINYVKKMMVFGTPGYERLWRRSAHVECLVVLVTRLKIQTLVGLCFLGPHTYCSLGVCLCVHVHSWLHRARLWSISCFMRLKGKQDSHLVW